MPLGRPAKWTDPTELQKAIDAYFAKCDEGKDITIIRKGKSVTAKQRIPYTVIGLSMACGFTSRQSLHDYVDRNQHSSEDAKDSFADIIARARSRIEDDNVTGGMTGEYESKITGLNLASNYGYSTKSEVNQSGTMTIQVINYKPIDLLLDVQEEAA